ncbi:MAG: hypothetical protein JSS52_00850 [Proteobacteria bacterium]|nr:hypothetical protein [Pseudomonadota bacterium]
MTEDADVPALNVQVELHDLRREMGYLRKAHSEEMEALRADIRELLNAWNTARALVDLVKVLGYIAAALAAIIAFLHVWKNGK